MDDNKTIILANVDAMLEDGLQILEQELLRYKTKATRGTGLNPMEAKTLQGYIKSLVDLSREERERSKSADLGDATIEELLTMLPKDQVARVMEKVQQKLIEGKK